ncbi:hypothetical protein E2562_015035 [Oryza meyeriana var. granulata]|uniref:Uncharacterized protein n=1 Tax=Oryza meyeriana var. granulata TaxID=110450 RepID=A0A6G1EJX2_9ORYZ|nr:hypothetical protein E2562_015035 [Oryza meyeriana var. granulata]
MFGIGKGCFRLGFEVVCDLTFQPPRLFFAEGSPGHYGPTQETHERHDDLAAGGGQDTSTSSSTLEIFGISLSQGFVRCERMASSA